VKIHQPKVAVAPYVVDTLNRVVLPEGDAFAPKGATAQLERSLRHVTNVLTRIADLHSEAVAADGLKRPESIYSHIVLSLTPEYGPERIEVPEDQLYRELREVQAEIEKVSMAVRLVKINLQHGY
jgi:hypothetical protein